MSRTVPYHPDDKCDQCGCDGAYDFMGDFLCSKCAALTPSDTDDWDAGHGDDDDGC